MRGERPALPALTGIRFFAAFYVVLFHFSRWYFTSAPQWVQNFFGGGYVGVDLFFVLSGFVLAYTYLEPGTTHVPRRQFWVARIARIYPMYLVAFALAFPLAAHAIASRIHGVSGAFESVGTVAATATLVQAWLPQTATVINGPGWSLSVEAFFYLVFPFIAVGFTRLRGKRLLAAGLIIWLAAIAVPTIFVLAYGAAFSAPAQPNLGTIGVMYNPVLHLPEFLIGIVSAVAFSQRERPSTVWLAPASLGVAVIILALSSRVPFLLIQNGLLAPLFALVLFGLAGGSGWFAMFLGWRPITILGEASYSIYILQAPLWYGLVAISFRVFHSRTPYLGRPLYFIGYSVLLIAVSVSAMYLLEGPARRAIRRAFGVRQRPSGALVNAGLAKASTPQ